jgi:hypothetical protein
VLARNENSSVMPDFDPASKILKIYLYHFFGGKEGYLQESDFVCSFLWCVESRLPVLTAATFGARKEMNMNSGLYYGCTIDSAAGCFGVQFQAQGVDDLENCIKGRGSLT